MFGSGELDARSAGLETMDGALDRGSMPCSGTSPVLTFNLINILAESANRSNAVFWLTVWLTVKRAKVRAARNVTKTQRFDKLGPRTADRGYCGRFLISFGLDYRGGPRLGWFLRIRRSTYVFSEQLSPKTKVRPKTDKFIAVPGRQENLTK